MIVASMCTIPTRKDSFKQVVRRILHEQTRPVDRLHVRLNGYRTIDTDLLQGPRLEYHLEPENLGPWVRYRVLDGLGENDILVTLDDDLLYSSDYIHRGVDELTATNPQTAISFGGFWWDPLVKNFAYGSDRRHYAFDGALSTHTQLAILMGGVSFFRGETVKSVINLELPGFRTNDDLMVSTQLQRRGVRILCCPKPAGWIRELDTSQASHALFVRDVRVRHETFHQMVTQLGFDPTVGRLDTFRKKPHRILVLADTCPPLPGSESLNQLLRALCSGDTDVHLIAPVPASRASHVQRYVDVPYHIHAVAVPEPGGRLDWSPPVRTWRNSRVRAATHRRLVERARLAREKLQPCKTYWSGQGEPAWPEAAGDYKRLNIKYWLDVDTR